MKILLRLLALLMSSAVFGSGATATPSPAANRNPGVPITMVPNSIPYAGQTDVQLQATYQQYKALKAQLLEERREAIVSASQQTDPNARLKIMATLEANQRDRLQQLRQMHAQILPLEEQDRAAARALKLGQSQ